MTEDYGSADYSEKENGDQSVADIVSFADCIEAFVDDMPAEGMLIEYALNLAGRVRVPMTDKLTIIAAYDPLDAIKIHLEAVDTGRAAVLFLKARHPRLLFSFGDTGQAVMLLGAVTDEVEILEKILSWVTGLTDKTPA